MKPKLLPPLDVEATAKRLAKKWAEKVHKAHGHVGEVYASATGQLAEVIIETNLPEWLKVEMEFDIAKEQNCHFQSAVVHPGQYDWRADTYIKDAVSVYFHVRY